MQSVEQQRRELNKHAYLLISKYLAAANKEGQVGLNTLCRSARTQVIKAAQAPTPAYPLGHTGLPAVL